MRKVGVSLFFFLAVLQLPGGAPAQDIVISEIMASNRTTIEDDDGNYSDWIELFNAGTTATNLLGWSLTDDPLVPTKWQFPSITMQPGSFLLVFASGKDRRNPSLRLHTSFKLSMAGEYLALVAPDGSTVVWEYEPYPPQYSDFSYGLAQHGNVSHFVASGAAGRALVPTSDALGLTWTQVGFNDSSWTAGTMGVGYERGSGYESYISMDVGSQMYGNNSTVYVRIPFTVTDASQVSNLVIRMKYDDGYVAYINGVKVAGRSDPATPSWNSTTQDNVNRDEGLAVIFEEIDISSYVGALRDGANILAIHGLNSNNTSSDFFVFPEMDGYSSGELERDVKLFFPEPSPGYGNLQGYPGVSQTPQASPAGTVLTGPTAVALSVASPQAVIRYTTNGSEPTESSPVYSGPISVTTTTLVRAKGFEPDFSPSATVSEGYVYLAASAQSFTSNLPVIVFDNFAGGAIDANVYKPGLMAIFEPVSGTTSLTNAPTLQARIGIKTRGSSTVGQLKQNYAVEVWDEKNKDKDISPLGMPEDSDWVFYAPYNFDIACIRNGFIYELSNQVGRYATQTRYVEVFTNTAGGSLTSAHYVGLYSFIQKIKRGNGRVDVKELQPEHVALPEISGGYMLKIDRLDPGDSGFSAAGMTLGLVYPKEDDILPVQQSWIQSYFNEFATALNGANYRDPVVGYAKYVDVDSWIDHHILNVLPMNVDALRLSTYFFKDRGGKIEYGPIWDFDRSMNSTDGRDDNPSTWNGTGDATPFFTYPWWVRLFQDPDFWQRWRDRWAELRDGVLSTSHIRALIDSMASEISEARVRNFNKWTNLGGGGTGWQNDISNMKTWLSTRASWIDSQFLTRPALSHGGGMVTPGLQVTITAPLGTIYYELDGSDPRLRGGGVAGDATSYSGPITITENTRIVARATSGTTNWSAPAAATYVVSTPLLVVTEIMYHPSDPPPESTYTDEDFEFIELMNAGDAPMDIGGARILGGIQFVFPQEAQSVLDPGEYVVVVRNQAAFEELYGTTGIYVAGEYTGNLANEGDSITVEGPLLEPILAFSYSDTWFLQTDGLGYSLVITDPMGALASWGNPQSWSQGTVEGGTPGAVDPGFPLAGGRQRPGDSNQDGNLDISDALSLLRRLFVGGSLPPPCEESALNEGGNLVLLDVDGNGQLNLTDPVYILAYLFQSGPAPTLGSKCIRIEGCPDACGY